MLSRSNIQVSIWPKPLASFVMLTPCAAAVIRVPTPCSVNNSSSTACGTRPSRMTTPSTRFDRVEAGFDLGDHAAGDRAIGDQRARLGDGQFA